MIRHLFLTPGMGVVSVDPVRFLWRTAHFESQMECETENRLPLQPGHYEIHLAGFGQDTGVSQARLDFVTDGEPRTITLAKAGGIETDTGYFLFVSLDRPVWRVVFFPGLARPGEFRLATIECRRLLPGIGLARRCCLRARMVLAQAPIYNFFARLVAILRREGVRGPVSRARVELALAIEKIKFSQKYYWLWRLLFDRIGLRDRRLIVEKIETLARRPKFTFLMPLPNSSSESFERTIASIRAQLYSSWEVFVCHDGAAQQGVFDEIERACQQDFRIRWVRCSGGDMAAACNEALSQAGGEFVGFIDAGDELPVHAFYMMAECFNRRPKARIFYSDEDRLDERSVHIDVNFKPEWNEYLFSAGNYIGRLSFLCVELAREVGGFGHGFEDAMEYDFLLRCVERILPGEIVHVPCVLCHRRAAFGVSDLSLQAINEYFQRKRYAGESVAQSVAPLERVARPVFRMPEPEPSVAIVIPTRNQRALLSACVESLLAETDYQNYRIVVVDNRSDAPDALDYLRSLEIDERVQVLTYDRPFNYSAINNFAVAHTGADVICLLNNDTKVLSGGWLREMVSHAVRPGIGAVGAKLLYPDGAIQHAGVIVGGGGSAVHCFRGQDRDSPNYGRRAAATMELSAVTAACMVLRREAFWAAGGFDESGFKVAFNDIDLCLRLRELGLRNIYTPFVDIIHHESKSLGNENTRVKQERFRGECDLFKRRWAHWMRADPAYNPNLSLGRADFSLSLLPRARKLWKHGASRYLPPNPGADEEGGWTASGYGMSSTQLPEAFAGLPTRGMDFESSVGKDEGMFLQQVTVDGWRDIGVTKKCAAEHVARVTGWAYAGAGEHIRACFLRARCGDRLIYGFVEPVARRDVALRLDRAGASECGFDARILRAWLGLGFYSVDLIHIYESFAVEMRSLLEVHFSDGG